MATKKVPAIARNFMFIVGVVRSLNILKILSDWYPQMIQQKRGKMWMGRYVNS